MANTSKEHHTKSQRAELAGCVSKIDKSDIERRFNAPTAEGSTFNAIPLEQYFKDNKVTQPLVLAKTLDKVDWSEFEKRYANLGRPPYAPGNMMGLILYGIMQGINSLRKLERLGKLDMGCHWVSGGIKPDHASIGRFIVMHSDSITNDFFDTTVRMALNATGSGAERVAGDGTVMEAACSHYKLMKEEAIKAAAEQAQKHAAAAPGDAALEKAAREAEEVEAIFEERKQNRASRGKDTSTLKMSPTEPEAMVQKAKRNRGFIASYKPSVMVNECRIVVATATNASNENTVVAEMLDQIADITGAAPAECLLDAGYFQDLVIEETLERDVSLLCPEGQKPGKPKNTQKFHKSEFNYNATEDSYTCPGGQKLIPFKTVRESPSGRSGYTSYGKADCQICEKLNQCTSSKSGREVKRSPADEKRDALREVMKHPQAQKVFRKRQAMVEPVFGYLRQVQGLNRFLRRGLRGVQREFGLHILAYNLSRVVAHYEVLFLPDIVQNIVFLWRCGGFNILGVFFRRKIQVPPAFGRKLVLAGHLVPV